MGVMSKLWVAHSPASGFCLRTAILTALSASKSLRISCHGKAKPDLLEVLAAIVDDAQPIWWLSK